MTTTRAPALPPRTRPPGVLERLGATVALVTFVVGVPLALRVVAPLDWPRTVPTWAQIRDALISPTDVSSFITALAVICWAGWAVFTFSVVVEIVAAMSRRPAPSIPLLGISQRAASALVATAGLMLSSAGPILGAPAAHAAPAIERIIPDRPADHAPSAIGRPTPATADSEPGSDGSAATGTEPGDRHPVVTVQHGDSLWGLAERHLGDGRRFTEIRDLNLHRPQPDGRALDDAHWIYPGWQLKLPTDAGALPSASVASSTTSTPDTATATEHVVVAGESLWEIAAQHLGDGARYPEIYALNAEVPQADGARLTDADVIHTGWRLQLPATPAQAPPGQPEIAPSQPAPIDSGARASDPVQPRVPAPATAAPAGADDAPVRSDQVVAAPVTEPGTDLSIELVLGLTGLAAAGFVGELARRRARQHRLRRTAERLPQPEPTSPEAATERTLRRAHVPFTPAALRDGLQQLAPACHRHGRPLPRVGAVVVDQSTIELLLTEDDTDPVTPWTSAGSRIWRTSHHDFLTQAPAEDSASYPAPYPALVGIGVSHARLVVINLEAAGTLTIDGPDDTVVGVLRALAVELATSELSAGLDLVLGPELGDLAGACPSVVIRAESGPDLDARLRAATGTDGHVLAGADAADTLDARSRRVGEDSWIPTVFIATDLPDAAARPWSGHATITTSSLPGWHLTVDADGTGSLVPLGLAVETQLLDPATYTSVLAALSRAATDPVRQDDRASATLDAETAAIRAVVRLSEPPLAAAATSPPVGDRGIRDGQKPAAQGSTPRVHVLGPVTITGIEAEGASDRRRRHTELVAFLALNPGATSAQVDDVIGHGRRIDAPRRNQDVSRARNWLGHAADGHPYLPKLTGHDDYRLDPAIRTDWDDFRILARHALATEQVDARDLREALDLVRGGPFEGVPSDAYDWAEPLIAEMTAEVVDTAHILARIELDAGRLGLAKAATVAGLAADPCNEMLFRDAIEAAHRAGDNDEVNRLSTILRARVDEIDPGCDLEDETVDLLNLIRA
jgi:nucleoid-associated protein YgaU